MNWDNLILPKVKIITCCKLECECGFKQYPIQLGIPPKNVCPKCGKNLVAMNLKEIE